MSHDSFLGGQVEPFQVKFFSNKIKVSLAWTSNFDCEGETEGKSSESQMNARKHRCMHIIFYCLNFTRCILKKCFYMFIILSKKPAVCFRDKHTERLK